MGRWIHPGLTFQAEVAGVNNLAIQFKKDLPWFDFPSGSRRGE
jgi:hypothetical protein